jgi:hypothetical protein
MSTNTSQQELDNLVKSYLDNVTDMSKIHELEVRFGTARGMRPITRIDYENVIKRLRSQNFIISDNQHMLRIMSEFTDPKTGHTKMSNIRAEITGLGEISNYCRTNDIKRSDGTIVARFIQKTPYSDNKSIVNFEDFNFRVALNVEKDFTRSSLVKSIVSSWKDTKKIFRYISRYSLTNQELGVQVDVSIVKESVREGKYLKKAYTFEESGLMTTPDKYEIEIEAMNKFVGPGTKYNTAELFGEALRYSIKLVLSGIQKTNYPISITEQNTVLKHYMMLLWGDEYTEGKRVTSKNFVGPSSYTLQIQNISAIDDNSNIPNIRTDYTVTDKADGERKLLYINNAGKIYLIDTNMNVQFTGSKTSNTKLFNTLLDGEHILHDKKKQFINLYAAFDVYYINNKEVRHLGFVARDDENKNNFRLPLLLNIIKDMKVQGITRSVSPIRIENKTFYNSSDKQTIFQACKYILNKVENGLFEYETDGLIFTPSRMGVGGDKIGTTTRPIKTTWIHSFKWKPPEFNTIDFLITTKKGTDGRDMLGNIFQGGIDTSSASQFSQYKTVILRVGFDERTHGYINPCKNIIDDDVPDGTNVDDEEGYKPVQFFPTNPSDDKAGICNILLVDGKNGDKVMMTTEHDIIEDNMIVEFKYDDTKSEQWRWVPLRVRYDKTAEFRSGGRNYGNAYHVANSNWHSIHNPVTVDMITTGAGIPEDLGDDDVYYNRVSGATMTRALRDFHNLYVKKKLIMSVSKRGDTLIDLAVGKAGDFPKWINAKLKFVFGIDISRDNIENRLDGACARFLNYKKKYNRIPDALFVVGNSSLNVRNGDALITEKGKQITNAVFGTGSKDVSTLGKGVYKQYAIAENGFDICSIQFALHYMFENKKTLHNFLRNVSETTKVGGYFIGTSYDGRDMFNLLSRVKQNENIQINEKGSKIWEVTKRYDNDEFPDNVNSVGYAIDVFQESINKTFREYLVNYEYLTNLLENYGFVLITKEESRELGLPSPNGSFRDLFRMMEKECDTRRKQCNDYGIALEMSSEEKKISYLNKYFVYKKTHNVDAKQVATNMMGESAEQHILEEKESQKAKQVVESIIATTKVSKPAVKKLKKRIKLVE